MTVTAFVPRQATAAELALQPALVDALLAPLPRSDQRRRGLEYVGGLLTARGRKSIRNLAASVGGDEQRLHHFVASSTWSWDEVRRNVAAHVAATGEVRAWVLRPSVIPRRGDKAVGVRRHFQSDLARTRTAQVAAGLWAVGHSGTCTPVHWRLHLPDSDDTLEHCLVRALAEAGELPVSRPVIVDARHLDVAALLDELSVAGVPAVLRVRDDVEVVPDDPTVGPGRVAVASARSLLDRVAHLRCPVADPSGRGGRTPAVAAVRVARPPRRGGGRVAPGARVRVVGTGPLQRGWPERTWLATHDEDRFAELALAARATDAVERDVDEVAGEVGLHDFSGRSFEGWHRHMTLASIAHGIRSAARHAAPAAPRVA